MLSRTPRQQRFREDTTLGRGESGQQAMSRQKETHPQLEYRCRCPTTTSAHPFDELVGPFHDTAAAARRLKVAQHEVMALARQNRLLGCLTDTGALVFPTFQFEADGRIVTGLAEVIEALTHATADAWQMALWMTSPSNELSGRTPLEALRRGDDRDALAAAEHTAVRWKH